MEESTEVLRIQDNNSNFNDLNILAELKAQDTSPIKKSHTASGYDSSDEDAAPQRKVRKRVQHFSDSDTEKENIADHNNDEDTQNKSDSETENMACKSGVTKSRIQLYDTSSDSDTPNDNTTLKNEEQQIRMKNKRNKLQQKFKGLLSSRSKPPTTQNQSDVHSSDDEKNKDSGSEASDGEISSIAKIKQKIKKSMAMIPSICDPDTSDEEGNRSSKLAPKQKQKKSQKSTKMIEAKPIRMSAKQAMENMHLIKSESNRMLREKAVSLPYHRPKALSLKDIMARRKPAVSSDGKVLPIKMNEEQLRQYAQQLEQRQKEMMELCKSESDEDTAEPDLDTNPEEPMPNNTEKKELDTTSNIEEPNKTDITDINTNIENDLNEDINSIQNEPDQIVIKEMDTPAIVSSKEDSEIANESINSESNQNDSNTDVRLVYNNDSIEGDVALDKSEGVVKENVSLNKVPDNSEPQQEDVTKEEIPTGGSEQESQLMSLHYTEINTEEKQDTNVSDDLSKEDNEELFEDNENAVIIEIPENNQQNDFFSDEDDLNMEDIDKIIENAKIMKDDDENINSPMLMKDPINMKPKIMGAPGMVIDLDGTDPFIPKRSGVELLKERFIYFSKLKTPEEMERDREKRLKPGAQHLKLKQELEEKIAEQRCLEWAKRLEEEKQLHQEMDAILDDADDADDSIEKIEAKLGGQDEKEESSESEEEELVEDDIEIKDKPRKHNPMFDDEAEESDIDENEDETRLKEANGDVEEDDGDVEDDNQESSDEEESSESEEEEDTTKAKKGRILKAFEDSDDEDVTNQQDELESGVLTPVVLTTESQNKIEKNSEINDIEPIANSCEVQGSSQDDVIQLAQRDKSASDDLLTSQDNSMPNDSVKDGNRASDEVLGTQTFSISSANPADFISPSQPYHDPALNAITDEISKDVLGSQLPSESQSQPIGEDILALCTGQFYDNEFVSQTDTKPTDTISQAADIDDNLNNDDKNNEELPSGNSNLDVALNTKDSTNIADTAKLDENNTNIKDTNNKIKEDGNLLKSILDELDDPEFDKPKANKFFTGATVKTSVVDETFQMKKRLIIDSDDETNENVAVEGKKIKKLKKKRLEKRALQISDDEDDEEEVLGLEKDDYMSDLGEDGERVVEYDSEENEIEVKPDNPKKKKRKATDFFEDEAELTSEDEWVGSGDEDEHGLDRMEREEGDDDVFHQGKLRNELGQIHMRDVLDQDKREVRLLQELLFEDGDLGGGHRQRKFRWRNAGDEETGTVPDEFADTQEEEFESEEQWRKQRHEREVFLRQMQKQDEDESLNVTVNRTSIIKANLISKSMSTLLMEANQTKVESVDSPAVAEKKTVKDIPSPKKSFSILKQNYHSSLLTRGRGALARLAALATPLVADDDAPKIGSLAPHKRNFVFAALTQEEEKPKVTIKRKADVNAGTPKLVKKMRIEDKQNQPKSSLLDHFKP